MKERFHMIYNNKYGLFLNARKETAISEA